MASRRSGIAFAAATLGSLALIAAGPLQRRIELIGEDDLSRIWAGLRAIATGRDPYDPATWAATAVSLGTQLPDTPVFVYPPWVAVPLLPLGLLPLPVVSILWLVASLALAIVAIRAALARWLPGRARDHAIAAVALLLSWVGMLTLVIGQWGYVLVAALFAATLALRGGRPVVAGLAAAAMMAKPQLFLFTAPALAVQALWPERPGGIPPRRGVTFVVTALGAAVALVAIGWAVVPSWWPTWPQLVGAQQTRPFSDTIPALLLTLGGPNAILLSPLLLFALVAIALRFHPRGDAWSPVWMVVSIAGAPYTNSYDQIVLIVPIVLAAGALHGRSLARSRAALWGGAAVLLLLTPLMYQVALIRRSETFGVIVTLLVFAIVTGSLWPYRREAPTVSA